MNMPVLAASLLVLLVAAPGFSQETREKSAMPVYVTPYYDSKGLKISVGDHSKALAEADAKTIGQLASDLKKERDKLRPEVMFVVAIRLYDLGQKDEAVYWFYAAQYRARVFGSILDKAAVGSIGSEAFELQQAYGAFQQLAGTYINGYGFGDLEKLEKTLKLVIEEGKTLPKFGELFPQVKFIAEDGWAAKNEDVSKGLGRLIEYIKNNADSIKAERKKNGVEGKY